MKRFVAMLLALMFLLMVGCAGRPAVYTVEYNGGAFAVDREAGTVTHGEDVYKFKTDTGSIDITYPNGAVYWWRTSGNTGHGGWDDTYDAERYVSGSVLVDILEKEVPTAASSAWVGKIILFAVLMLLGLWQLIWPQAAWYWRHGWQYKNAEPSDAGLAGARFGGAVFIILAVVQLFIW